MIRRRFIFFSCDMCFAPTFTLISRSDSDWNTEVYFLKTTWERSWNSFKILLFLEVRYDTFNVIGHEQIQNWRMHWKKKFDLTIRLNYKHFSLDSILLCANQISYFNFRDEKYLCFKPFGNETFDVFSLWVKNWNTGMTYKVKIIFFKLPLLFWEERWNFNGRLNHK